MNNVLQRRLTGNSEPKFYLSQLQSINLNILGLEQQVLIYFLYFLTTKNNASSP